MSDLIGRLRNMHFNNAEEGRGGPFREISARDLRNANELFTKSANTLEARDKTIAELVEALGTAMDFIDSHVADPDLTAEMWGHYRKLDHMEPRRLISQAQSKDKAE